jgi:hypothetical protein
MWKGIFKGVALCALILCAVWTIWIVTKLVSPELSLPGVGVTAPRITYAELIAVLLTGLAVSLGLLGLVVAGLALWGYRAIRDEAKAIASRVARSETRKRVLEYLRTAEGMEIVESEVAKRFDELKEGLALAGSQPSGKTSTLETSGNPSPRVGRPYRKGKGAE